MGFPQGFKPGNVSLRNDNGLTFVVEAIKGPGQGKEQRAQSKKMGERIAENFGFPLVHKLLSGAKSARPYLVVLASSALWNKPDRRGPGAFLDGCGKV